MRYLFILILATLSFNTYAAAIIMCFSQQLVAAPADNFLTCTSSRSMDYKSQTKTSLNGLYHQGYRLVTVNFDKYKVTVKGQSKDRYTVVYYLDKK